MQFACQPASFAEPGASRRSCAARASRSAVSRRARCHRRRISPRATRSPYPARPTINEPKKPPLRPYRRPTRTPSRTRSTPAAPRAMTVGRWTRHRVQGDQFGERDQHERFFGCDRRGDGQDDRDGGEHRHRGAPAPPERDRRDDRGHQGDRLGRPVGRPSGQPGEPQADLPSGEQGRQQPGAKHPHDAVDSKGATPVTASACRRCRTLTKGIGGPRTGVAGARDVIGTSNGVATVVTRLLVSPPCRCPGSSSACSSRAPSTATRCASATTTGSAAVAAAQVGAGLRHAAAPRPRRPGRPRRRRGRRGTRPPDVRDHRRRRVPSWSAGSTSPRCPT